MTAISNRDALQLAADIRETRIAGHAIAVRHPGSDRHCSATFGFLGGLESVLHHFLLRHAGQEAAVALVKAMNYEPTTAEVDAHNAALLAVLKERAHG